LAYGLHALGENDRALETLRQVLKNDSGASATIRRQAEDLARKIGGP
jgi:TolA-binding protein